MSDMTLHIGILAHSAEGATLCYRTLWLEGIARMGAARPSRDHPDRHRACTTRSRPGTAATSQPCAPSSWPTRRKLAAAGADFFVLPDNTAHIALEAPGEPFPIPCLHIGEVVADAGGRRRPPQDRASSAPNGR